MSTYYTSSSASGGGAGSFGDPFTLQEGFDAITAGNELRILNDGIYTPSAQLDFDTNVGTITSPIVIRGRASDDSDYEMATISGSSLPATTDLLSFACATYPYCKIRDLRFTAATRDNVTTSNNTQRYISFDDCRFDNAGRYGIIINTYWIRFVRCEIDNNTSYGVNLANQVEFLACRIHNNTFGIVGTNEYSLIYGCLFYGNSNDDIAGAGNRIHVVGNTFYGTGAEALDGVAANSVIIGNIFCNCTVDAMSDAADNWEYEDYNVFYNNGTDKNGDAIGEHSITGTDPGFTSTTSGSEDFSISSSSPAKAAGLPGVIPGLADSNPATGYMDIGALQRQEPAGGGGGGAKIIGG